VTAFVALLRGINVGGNRKVTMDEVRKLVSDLGHDDVSTYLQSGNVRFASADADPDQVSAELRQALKNKLGLDIDILLRTRSDLEAVLAGNPYLAQESDPTKLHVTFLQTAAVPAKTEVPIPAGETGVLTVAGREVYLHCPAGYGRTKLNNTYLERKLGLAATTRNWKSVVALHDLLGA
jgi:uncharacterized protein (DUF1697 family)